MPGTLPSRQANPEFVAITGRPGPGKTSVFTHLRTGGYATVPEAALQIIDELNQEHGVAGQTEW